MATEVYGITECAEALGISRQRALQLHQEGKLPAPFARVRNGRCFWLARDFDRFAQERRSRLAAADTEGSGGAS